MSELNKQEAAVKKLQAELKKVKDEIEKGFAEPVIEYLEKRIGEDEGFAEDVLKSGKTWSGCFSYLFSQAKQMAGGKKQLAVRNDAVFEWAEDYYRKEDKDLKTGSKKASSASKTAKPKTEAAMKEGQAEPSTVKTKIVDKEEKTVDKKTESVSGMQKPVAEEPKKEKPKKAEVDGQMSIFDLLGGLDG